MKTVKIKKMNLDGSYEEDRVELFEFDPDGCRNPSVCIPVEWVPRPRSGICKNWKTNGESDVGWQWWSAC